MGLKLRRPVDVRRTAADYIIITAGTFFTALGIVVFLVPFNIIAGGVSGLSMVTNYLFNWWIGTQMLIYNMFLFILAFWLLGVGFGVKSIYSAVTLSVFIDLLQQGFKLDKLMLGITSSHSVDMTLLSAVYGAVITGFGVGIVIWRGATTGGTDILAMIMNKYLSISVGTSLIIVDSVITALSLIINPLIPMYGLITIFISSKVIDAVVDGFESTRTVLIISDYYDKIKERIYTDLDRGVTYLKGTGTYTNKDKNIVMVTVPRTEIGMLKKIIKEVDPASFTTVLSTNETIGYGFKKITK
ncbi:MAG TPA: YitT family protein [Petrotogaceae bacterium]|nr:YitT family protein [Petrotogaceae bacterium]HQO12840.1 YitT family protein [Petrotogaceae bacterium]HQP58562.1 YitT family protein [Petrotogaceae bacterium]